MSPAARSLFVYGVYLCCAGAGMLLVPQLFILLFALPAGSEVMLRFGGVLTLALGFYDVAAARTELLPFLRWSVLPRAGACLAFGALWVLGLLPARLLLVGAVDLACAAWTWSALRASGRTGPLVLEGSRPDAASTAVGLAPPAAGSACSETP